MSDNYLSGLGKRLGTRGALAIGIPLALLVVGVGLYFYGSRSRAENLDSVYGKRSGRQATASVNGTRVLAEMFIKNGHRVRTLSRLSPGINQRADVIVWIPDSFEPPDKKQREFLESWLAQGRGRTLIYVGRDYDAAGEYYQKIAPLLKPSEAVTFKRFEAEAKADYDSRRWEMPQEQYARWFTARRDGTKHVAKGLRGPWAAGIDSSKTEILIEGRLDPPVETDRTDKTADPPLPKTITPLLWSAGDGPIEYAYGATYPTKDAIVTRITDPAFGTGQVIVVTNGSFVLNYPLVNHEHRKLAGKLIEECAPGANVAFIESKNGEPTVLDKEPEAAEGAGLFDVARVWPLNAIVIHLTILGIIYCLAKSPIFGRARELPSEASADFGKHVTALGQLMARSKDRAYAEQRIQQYQQQGKRKSGKSHLKGA